MKDVLESFIAIQAGEQDIWPFLTELHKGAMWASPPMEFYPHEGAGESLEEGVDFDLVLQVPGGPAVTCTVASRQESAMRLQFRGTIDGIEEWRTAPVGDRTIVHCRHEFQITHPLHVALWSTGGRWLFVLLHQWQLRRLKGRVEDTVGSSQFGVPLPVSPYAAGCLLASLAGVAGLGLLLVSRMMGQKDKVRE